MNPIYEYPEATVITSDDILFFLDPLLRMLAPLFIFLAAVCVLGIIGYILRGIAIQKMSAVRGISGGWLGFIPIANRFQLGEVTGETRIGPLKLKRPGIWLMVLPIITEVVLSVFYMITVLPFVIRSMRLEHTSPEISLLEVSDMMSGLFSALILFILLSVVFQALLYLLKGMTLHKLFSQYAQGSRPVLFLLAALFVPLAEPILLFALRNKPIIQGEFAPQNGTAPTL